MWCDPDAAIVIAIAIANQDHGLDGYVGKSLDTDPDFSHSQVHEHMLMGCIGPVRHTL